MNEDLPREIRPQLHFPGEVAPVLPDNVPSKPGENDQLPRTSLVLYVYRVPGSRDLFLTQHKIPNDTPTSTDVNGSSYFIRYDEWPGPTKNYRRGGSNEGSTPGATMKQREWRNILQRSLDERGLIGSKGSKMCLVGVNMSRDDIREVATLVDPKTTGAVYVTESRYRTASLDHTNAENPLYIDIYSQAYKNFGLDVGYFCQGKAFTRRVFRADGLKPHYHFVSPWGGQVALERHAHGKPTLKGYHRMANRAALDGILTSELRPNFSPVRKTYDRSSASTEDRASFSYSRQTSVDSIMSGSDVGKLSSQREKLSRIRRRSEIISGSAKEKFNTMLKAQNRNFDDFTYDSSEFNFDLAHEPLGGGTGEEAKLAKLVIYPEGQDFIDLVVAANMLVFHSIYERAMPWLHQG